MNSNINRPGYKLTPLGWIPDDWKLSVVSRAFNICNHLRYPISEEIRRSMKGDYPYYGPTKIQDFINEYRVEGKFALIGEDGDHFLKWRQFPMTLLVEGKFNVNNHAHLIQGNDISITEWFFYYFNHRELTRYLTRQGAGRYKLTKNSLSKILVPLPSLNEQRKITEILSINDVIISKINQLISNLEIRNKALKQQLEKKYPRTMHILMSEVLKPVLKVVGSNTDKFELLSVTKNGIVSQKEYFNKEVASEDLTNYKIVIKGEVVMSGLNFWMGSIDLMTDFDVGIVSPAYKVFEVNTNKICIRYFKHFVKSKDMLRILVSCSIVGASIVRRNFDKEMFDNWLLKLPLLKDQKIIADILDCTANELKLQQQKLKIMKKQKMGLMRKLLTGEVRIKI